LQNVDSVGRVTSQVQTSEGETAHFTVLEPIPDGTFEDRAQDLMDLIEGKSEEGEEWEF
jgi:hypothetical protein